jgi:hypothetical protein
VGRSVSFFGRKSRPGGPCTQNLHPGHVGPCRSRPSLLAAVQWPPAAVKLVRVASNPLHFIHSPTHSAVRTQEAGGAVRPLSDCGLPRLDNRTRDIIHHRPHSRKRAPSATIVAVLTSLLFRHRDDPQSDLLFRLRRFPCLPRPSIADSNWPLPFAKMANPSLAVHR